MNQLAPQAFADHVRLVSVAEFLRLCSDVMKCTYALRDAHAYAVQRCGRSLRSAMTGLCRVELADTAAALEGKRRTAIGAGNAELIRHA